MAAVTHLVAESQLPFDDGQIPHHHLRRVRLRAAEAARLLAAFAGVFVEAHAKLRGPLEPAAPTLNEALYSVGTTGALAIDDDDPSTHYFTDFVVPGTLDDAVSLFQIIGSGKVLDATILVRPTSGDIVALDVHARLVDDAIVAVFRLAGDVPAPPEAHVVGRPSNVRFVPATDVAFRSYAQRALDRMPEATPDGLAIRLHRLYPHATVEQEADQWVLRRDRHVTEADGEQWFRQPDLPRVRYDAEALILEANGAAESFFGQQMVGHYWQEFVTPGSTDQVGIMLDILAEIGAAESRFRMPRGDGHLLDFDSYTETHGEEFVTVFRQADGA